MAVNVERIVFASHCILNQATRAWGGTGDASRERGMISEVIEVLSRHGVGIVQIGCPEFSLHGNPRPARDKGGYDKEEFRGRCMEIASEAVEHMVEMQEKGRDPRIRVVAVLGVEGSPSCGVERTPGAADEHGHLIDALKEEMARSGLEIPVLDVSLREGERRMRLERLEDLLRETDPLN